MSYTSLKELCETAEREKKAFWEVVIETDCADRSVDKEQSFYEMQTMYAAMKEADRQYNGKKKSASGMVGGDGEKLHAYNATGQNLSGAFLGRVMERAVKMAETNACMGRIVAAPTAGSCGVVPAVLLTYEEFYPVRAESNREVLKALYVAAGIGQVIAMKASISGAEGGCQAEVGSASAMAAGALVYLQGGSNDQILDAVAITIKNLLGLVCDPVAGLVEVPCVKRNVIGAVNAVSAADMAMAGIYSVIPADEAIEAMDEVGREMSARFRETSQGGLANTETGKRVAQMMEERNRLTT